DLLADDEADAPEVARVRAAHELLALGAGAGLGELLEAEDLLADAEDRAVEELRRDLGEDLQVDAVEAADVADGHALGGGADLRVLRRHVRVAGEGVGARAPDDGLAAQGEGLALGAVGADQ